MANSFTKCVTQVNLSAADKALIRQVETEYKADGLKPADAIRKAVADVLDNNVKKEYSQVEQQIADAGGYIDPYSVYVKGPEPEAPATPEATPEAAAKVAGKLAEPEPVEAPSADPYGEAATSGGFEYVGRFKAYAKQAEDASGLSAEDIAGFIEPNAKGKVGRPELKKATAAALAEREAATAPDFFENTMQEVKDAINAQESLFKMRGDESEEALLEHMETLEALYDMLAEIEDGMKLQAGAVINSTKKTGLYGTILTKYPESSEELKKLRSFYKGSGRTNAEAETAAATRYMIGKIKKQADEQQAEIDSEDKIAGVNREVGATGRAGDVLQNGPVTAGMGKAGIQGILKTSGDAWVDPRLKDAETVGGEAGLTNSGIVRELDGAPVIGLDVAMALADAAVVIDGKLTMPKRAVAFEANKLTKKNGVSIKKGEIGYWDARTKRLYADEHSMLYARGEAPLQGSKAPATAKSSDALSKLEAEMGDLKKSFAEKRDALHRQIEQLKNPAQPDPAREAAVRDADASVGEIPEGRRLTIMKATPNADGSHDMRVLQPHQKAKGGGVGTLLGREKPENWIVGHVDEGTKGGRRKADLFTSINAENPDPSLIKEKVPNEYKRRVLFEEVKHIEVPREIQELLAGQLKGTDVPLEAARIVQSPEGISNLQMVDFVVSVLEGRKWRGQAEQTARISTLKQVYDYLDSVAPNGFEYANTQKKSEAIDSLDVLYGNHTPEEIAGMKKLINDINSDNTAPTLRAGNGNNHAFFSPDPSENNVITLSGKATTLSQQYVFAHELGHWLYKNILTSTDKKDFWAAADGYYKADGRLDTEKVSGAVPNVQGLAPELKLKTNSMSSPQELFAEQFAMYVSQKQKYAFGDVKLWKKLLNYAKAVFDRVIDKKAIDPALEPLLAKLLLDPDDAARHASIKPSAPVELKPQGKFIQLYWEDLDSIDKRLNEAMMSGDNDELIRAADDLTVLMMKLTPKAGAQRALGKTPSGAFGPIKGIRNVIRKKLHQLQHVMRGAKDDSVGTYTQEFDSEYGDYGFSEVTAEMPDGFDTMHNYGDPDAVADAIREFMYDESKEFGQNKFVDSEFTDGVATGQTKMPVRGSLAQAIELMRRTLENQMHEMVPDGADIDAILKTVPEGLREGTKNGGKQNKASNIFRTRAKLRKQNAEDALQGQAASWAGGKGDALPSSGKDLPDIKGMSIRKLTKLYADHANTKEGQSIMYEVIRQGKMSSAPTGRPTASADQLKAMIHMDKHALAAAIIDAFNNAKPEAAHRFIWESQRRAYNKIAKKAKKDGKDAGPIIDPLTATTPVVNKSIEIEISDGSRGIIDGIPRNARYMVRDALGMMTHRNAAVQTEMRTLAYRMFNLMGRASKATPDEANLMTMDDLHRLSRSTNPTPTVTGVIADMASDEFKSLRSDFRKMAVNLSRGNTSPTDVMNDVGNVLMRTGVISDQERSTIKAGFMSADDAIKKRISSKNYGDISDNMKLERQAEEWFVEHWTDYIGERTAKGDVFGASTASRVDELELRNALTQTLDNVTEGAAYALNGLIGRKDIKQQYRRLTMYGDVTATKDTSVTGPEVRNYVPPEMGATRFSEVWNSSSVETKKKVRAFVGDGAGTNAEGEPTKLFVGMPNTRLMEGEGVIFEKSNGGNLGPAIYTTSSANIADKVYANKPTYSAWRKMIEMDESMPAPKKEEALALAGELTQYRQRLSRVKRELVETQEMVNAGASTDEFMDAGIGESAMPTSAQKLVILREQVELYEALEDSFSEALMEMDVDFNPGVMNVYVRAVNPVDLTRGATYTKSDSLAQSMVRFAAIKMSSDGATDRVIDETLGVLSDEMDMGGVSGHDLHEGIWKAIDRVNNNKDKSIADVTNFLTEQGYDSIKHTHTNTLGGNLVPHEVVALIDTIDADGNRVPPSSRIKHQDAKEFNRLSPVLNHSEAMDQPISLSTITSMSEESADSYESKMAALLQNAEEKGADSGLTNGMGKIAKGRVLSEEDVDGIHKATVAERILAPNSQRMRSTGLNWLANYVENYFPSVQHQFAKRYMPIRALLADLPDAPSNIAGWWAKNNPRTGGLHNQPDSHSRILRALRNGPDSRQWKGLEAKERTAALSIRKTLDEVHEKMYASNTMVGNIKNYMPQVWEKDLITKNQDGFTTALVRYLQAEDPTRGTDNAREVAQRITANIINDDGLYVPPPIPQSGGVDGHIDYQRLIRLDEQPGLYAEFEPFMQNNLDGLLVKYLDGTSKRLHQTNNIGVNIHGFSDYMDIGQNGLSAIARQLSTNKVFTKLIKGQDPLSSATETATLERVYTMPFSDANEANEAALEAIRQVKAHGVGGGTSYLLSLMPDEKITPTYRRRMDAIANAIKDFQLNEQGMPKAINRSEFDHAEGTMRVLQGKSVNPRESETAMNASRAVRAINAVSLLSFTALTSIPDAVLPLVRSGSFKDWTRGLAKFATDKHYRQEIKNTGVAIENALHSRMVGLYGADAKGTLGTVQSAFFNATMLTPWTDMWRGLSGAVALESFNTQVRKGVDGFKAGVPIQNQSREVKFAHRFLKRYGLEDMLANPRSAKLDPKDSRVAEAMIKFSNDTIFSPNPNDVPLAFQTPGGSILFQLKSFPLLMGRFGKDVLINDIKNGDFRRPLYFAAFAPAAGMAAIGTKDLVQSRGGEDGRSSEFRERNAGQLAKLFGYDPELHGNQDTFMGWYLEGLMAAGGFGLLGDVLHDITAQADNGSYGIQRTAGAILGPTFGLGASAVNVIGGAKEIAMDQFDMGSSGTNSKERLAAREMMGRIPVLGGLRNARETSVDFFAGEKKKEGGGWGSSY